MAETAVQIGVCEACGVDIRGASLFCYNCGERIKAEDPASDETETTGDDDKTALQPELQVPLKSAASLRKQRRAFSRQPVEVSWEQPSGSPVGFVIATIVLTVGALVLLFLALYLR